MTGLAAEYMSKIGRGKEKNEVMWRPVVANQAHKLYALAGAQRNDV
jgi:hypothetical protein